MRKEGNQIVETPVEARGGFLGKPVFVVLAVSLVLAIAAMALSYAGFFGTTEERQVGETRSDQPSVSIEATGDGLRWKVVSGGETVASGAAPTMEEAQAAADEIC